MADFLLPNWPAPAAVKAAVTLRTGGVSEAPYDSLNPATHVGDNAEVVAENRYLIGRALELPAEPCWLEQVHGVSAVDVSCLEQDSEERQGDAVKADASFCHQPEGVCVVQTADCLPVLFCNEAGSQVAAAHAGWRGLAAGVLENTLATFTDDAPVMAWMGPAISQLAFEVGPEVKEVFLDAANVNPALSSDAIDAAFIPSETEGKLKANLYALARQRLQAAGIKQIYGGGFCTFLDRKRFFSFRRDGVTGRMASLIWIDPRQE